MHVPVLGDSRARRIHEDVQRPSIGLSEIRSLRDRAHLPGLDWGTFN